MNDTQFEFVVNGRPFAYRGEGVADESKILTPDGSIPVYNVLNPLSHFLLRRRKMNVCRVYNSEVVFEKTRPLLSGAFRPSKYRAFVKGQLVVEHHG